MSINQLICQCQISWVCLRSANLSVADILGCLRSANLSVADILGMSINQLICQCQISWVCMGGRLPAVASMPANQTFLELCAGQSYWPEKKLRGFVTKKAQETCFVSPRGKAIFPMDSPLSQHIKRSLPCDLRYFPFALVSYSVTPTLTYFRPR